MEYDEPDRDQKFYGNCENCGDRMLYYSIEEVYEESGFDIYEVRCYNCGHEYAIARPTEEES